MSVYRGAAGVPGCVIPSVAIYFNGGVNMSQGRNLTIDGYNLGIRYQCVEFVKR